MTRNQIKNSALRIVALIEANANDHELNAAVAVFNYDCERWRSEQRAARVPCDDCSSFDFSCTGACERKAWHQRDAGTGASLVSLSLFIGMIAIWGMVLT